MPTYVYLCPDCRDEFEVTKPIAKLNFPEYHDSCYNEASRVIQAARVSGDYAPYRCPNTGKLISGRRQHEENLKRQGCRVFEAGETADFLRRRRSEDAAFERNIEDIAVAQVAQLDDRKLSSLGRELELGAGGAGDTRYYQREAAPVASTIHVNGE